MGFINTTKSLLIRICHNKVYWKIRNKKIRKDRDLFAEKWHQTEYPQQMKDIKDIHKDAERCFIIGNGPSLRVEDLDKLKNEITFSSNKIYKSFDKTDWRPYYYVVDDRNYVQDVETNTQIPSVKTFIGLEDNNELLQKYIGSKVIVFRKITSIVDNLPQISKNFGEYLGAGYTVALTQFQLAAAMGIKKIYFIGTDCSYSNNSSGKTNWFYGSDSNAQVPIGDESGLFKAFYAIKNYAEENDIEVYNATRGGKLEVFPRVKLDELI